MLEERTFGPIGFPTFFTLADEFSFNLVGTPSNSFFLFLVGGISHILLILMDFFSQFFLLLQGSFNFGSKGIVEMNKSIDLI